MTFYIPEFVCGVLATLIVEFTAVIVIVFTILRNKKGTKHGEEDKTV